MRILISDQTRQEAIAKWLSGWPRDKIAGELGIGAGTVTNIIAKWTDDVGTPTASAVRELSVEIRRAGMTIRDCARGLRFMRVISGRMENDDIIQFELFVNKVYNKCKYMNISPEYLVEIASEIWELSKIMPISQIPSYVSEKMKVKEDLEIEIKELDTKRSLAEDQYGRILHLSDTRAEALQEYLTAREFLSRYGLGTADLRKLMVTLQNGEKYGFNTYQIIEKISNNQSLEHEEQELRKRVAQERENLRVTENTSKELFADLERNALRLSLCDELKSMGFGFDQLTSLKNALVEIAKANKTGSATINPDDVVRLFFRRVEESRNLEARIELLKEEKNRIEEISSSLLNNLRESIETMIGKATKDVKEMSNMAIEAIKMAYERNNRNSAQNTT